VIGIAKAKGIRVSIAVTHDTPGIMPKETP